MKEEIQRLIDDLETEKESAIQYRDNTSLATIFTTNVGKIIGLDYAIKRLKELL